jgi:hypothetical protein
MVLEQRMEGVAADPGLVPQDVVAPDLLQHLAHVVDGAVVGGELNAGEPERALGLVPLLVGHARTGADLLAQIALVPGVPVDGSDHTERVVAVGRKIGIAPAPARAPWCRDLWLLRSKRTRSPRRSTALVTTLLEVLVPFRTK